MDLQILEWIYEDLSNNDDKGSRWNYYRWIYEL